MDFSYRSSYDLYNSFKHHRRCAKIREMIQQCLDSGKDEEVCRVMFEKYKDKCDLRLPGRVVH